MHYYVIYIYFQLTVPISNAGFRPDDLWNVSKAMNRLVTTANRADDSLHAEAANFCMVR
jgi:hypothetical protein